MYSKAPQPQTSPSLAFCILISDLKLAQTWFQTGFKTFGTLRIMVFQHQKFLIAKSA